jgi:hypothetical protein
MTTIDTAVFAWLVVAMGAACIAHLYAWQQTPRIARRGRRLHAVTALLALLYVAGYLSVLAGAVPILLWSQTFRGVSLVAIPVVWILPAVHLGRRWTRSPATYCRSALRSGSLEVLRATGPSTSAKCRPRCVAGLRSGETSS